jgi:predicted DNA-binding transcriptional regulator AlpA
MFRVHPLAPLIQFRARCLSASYFLTATNALHAQPSVFFKVILMHTQNSLRSAPQMPISVQGATLLTLVKVLHCQVRKGNSEYFGIDKINPNVLHQVDANGKYERIDVSEKIKITRRVTHYTGQQWARYKQRQTKSHPKHHKKKHGARHLAVLGNTPTKRRFISLKKVIDIVGFNKTFIYSRVDLNQFPQPVKLGNSRRAASRWVEEEVIAWVENLISSRTSTTLAN